jgi:hypothetical protein
MELVRVGGGEADLAMKLEDHHFNPSGSSTAGSSPPWPIPPSA